MRHRAGRVRDASLALFEGNMGYGQHVGRIAMDWAIGAAREHGHAVMGLRNVHHIGRVGTFLRREHRSCAERTEEGVAHVREHGDTAGG